MTKVLTTNPPRYLLTANRWWIFQRERFPILKYGLLIAIFSGSAVCYPALLHQRSPSHLLSAWAMAFMNVFCFFLQIRIADEFKDFEDDLRYRPDRPVPRGLVSLQELGTLGIGTALVQLGLALWLMPQLVPLLFLIWGYFSLMCVEFFRRDWLKAHFSIYMLSHMMILPLIALYAIACEGWLGAQPFSIRLLPFLLMCFCNGMVIEIGRKIRAPEDEQLGVQTYSAMWSAKNAVLVWLGVMGCTAIAAVLSAAMIQFTPSIVAILAMLFIIAAVTAIRFLRVPCNESAKWIDRLSGLWTLVLYFSAGLLPLIVRTQLQ